MDDYMRSLEKQLKGFPAEEQAALLAEIRSHVESGEEDPRLGKDETHRREMLRGELGTPEDMGSGFRNIYRPNRLVDYLFVAIPYILSLAFTAFYMQLRPQYPWMDIRLNVIMDLLLVAIGLGRKSALISLFWINMALMQLLYIVLQGVWQPYWYFGLQTVLWACLLAALLWLLGQLTWKNRRDPLIVAYALLPFCMQMLGMALWSVQPVNYIYNPVDRSLLVIFLRMQEANAQFYGTLAFMAVFFLASNRDMRWAAIAASALMIGLGRVYLFDYQTGAAATVAQWVYYLYLAIPVVLVAAAWALDWSNRQRVKMAA